MSAAYLNSDLLLHIAVKGGGEVIMKMALVCIGWRDAIELGSGGAFDIRDSLLKIKKTALLSQLVDVLCLTPMRIKVAPHAEKRRFGGGFYKVFTHAAAVRLFYKNGGWETMEGRMQKRAERRKRL